MKIVSSVSLAVATLLVGSAMGFAPLTSSQLATHQSPSTSTLLTMKSPFSESPESPFPSLSQNIKSAFLAASFLVGSAMAPLDNNALLGVPPADAAGSTVVGTLKGSGLVFKDTLNIERFQDPKVKGVELYISNFDRPITEKLNGNFFNDPSYASVACAKTGKVAIADNIAKGPGGEEVFEESKSLLFKTLRVQRIYDTDTNTVIYVSFNTRLDKGDDSNKSRFKSSLCAVNLNEPSQSPVAAPPASP